MSGFYIPDDLRNIYVNSVNKAQETAVESLGLSRAQALSTLRNQYQDVTENTYTNYLNNRNMIASSAMGQGYINAYMKQNEANMFYDMRDKLLAANESRAKIDMALADNLSAINESAKQTVAYYDRLSRSLEDYKAYVDSVEGPVIEYMDIPLFPGLTPKQPRYTTTYQGNDFYLAALGDKIQLQDKLDQDGEKGKSYYNWLFSTLSNNTADEKFREWLESGGLQEYYARLQRGLNK